MFEGGGRVIPCNWRGIPCNIRRKRRVIPCQSKVLGMGFTNYLSVHFNKLDIFIVITSDLG